MRKPLLIVAASMAAATVLSPCAEGQSQAAGSAGGHGCPASAIEHCIHVTVHGGTLSVDVPDQHIQGLGAGRHWIIWSIDTPGYAFSEDPRVSPIVFEADTFGQFDHHDDRRCYPWKTPQKFCCIDETSRRGRFKYTIRVTGPGQVAPLDPFISND